LTEVSQQPASPAPAAPTPPASPQHAAPDHEGPVTGLEHRFLGFFRPHAQHTEAGLEHVASDVQAALECAATTLPVAVKVLNAAKLVDPADGALLDAFGELLPEALSVAAKDVAEALAALKGGKAVG
jgi:hypothetical protein